MVPSKTLFAKRLAPLSRDVLITIRDNGYLRDAWNRWRVPAASLRVRTPSHAILTRHVTVPIAMQYDAGPVQFTHFVVKQEV